MDIVVMLEHNTVDILGMICVNPGLATLTARILELWAGLWDKAKVLGDSYLVNLKCVLIMALYGALILFSLVINGDEPGLSKTNAIPSGS